MFQEVTQNYEQGHTLYRATNLLLKYQREGCSASVLNDESRYTAQNG